MKDFADLLQKTICKLNPILEVLSFKGIMQRKKAWSYLLQAKEEVAASDSR